MRSSFKLLVITSLILSFSASAQRTTKRVNPLKKTVWKIKSKITKKKSALYTSEQLASKYASWGISSKYQRASINLEKSWKIFKKKGEVVVAVIDTGIQANHPYLKSNLVVIGKNGKVIAATEKNFGRDFALKSKKSLSPTDTHGHGTHVSGIIKSIFPEVKILSLKYYNPKASGQANLDSTIKCLRYAVDNKVDMINYSGGGPEPSREELEILKEAEEKGILIIAAAGNERSNIDIRKNAYYPASYGLDNIITVGAINQNANIISSSNWGKNSVDIAAPGFRIKSTVPFSSAGHMTGTSQATAFVTGVAALIKSNYPTLSSDQIKNIILASSVKQANLNGKILGGGRLDAYKALALGKKVVESSQARKVAKRD